MPTLTGWRLCLVVLSFCLGLLLSGLESTIIATALVTISSDLGGFSKSNWIVEAFFLTYTGFLICYSRLSDIYGRKNMLLIAATFFTLWSLACGLARTINELIVFRALQGIGGSGLFSLGLSSIPEVVPPKHLGVASGVVSGFGLCASVLGPVIGGAITSNTTWRWVFWFNVPGGLILIAAIIFIFPYEIGQKHNSGSSWVLVDWPGMVLSLTAATLLIFALEEGGSQYSWQSSTIITSLVFSAICWVGFAVWEWNLTTKATRTSKLPVLPTILFSHRVIGTAFLTALLSGFPFLVTLINLPQRFQIVNSLSPVQAGIRMLPLLISSAVGAGLTGIICARKNISFYLIALSNVLQILGTGLMSVSAVSSQIPISDYVIESVLGFAFGSSAVCLMITSRVEVDPKHSAVAIGTMTQTRVFGGVVGLAVCQLVILSRLQSQLSQHLTPQQLRDILVSAKNIDFLSPDLAQKTRQVYGDGANFQMRIAMVISIASLVVGLFMWRQKPIQLSESLGSRTENIEMGSELPNAP